MESFSICMDTVIEHNTKEGVINLSIALPAPSTVYISLLDVCFLNASNAGGISVGAAGNDASGDFSVYLANSAYTRQTRRAQSI